MGERPERVGLRGLRVDRRVYSFFKHAGVAQGFAMATAHGSTAPTSFALKQHHALGGRRRRPARRVCRRFLGGDLTDMAFAMSCECRSETLALPVRRIRQANKGE